MGKNQYVELLKTITQAEFDQLFEEVITKPQYWYGKENVSYISESHCDYAPSGSGEAMYTDIYGPSIAGILEKCGFSPNLSGLDLSGKSFPSANFSGVNLSNAICDGTTFEKVIFGDACLEGAILDKAIFIKTTRPNPTNSKKIFDLESYKKSPISPYEKPYNPEESHAEQQQARKAKSDGVCHIL